MVCGQEAGMNFQGIIVGALAFLIIGLFHPIVIKAEYYFSKKIWPLFLISGVLFLGWALLVTGAVLSSALGVLGFTCLWSILELFEQEERVKKGWFPQNPKRK